LKTGVRTSDFNSDKRAEANEDREFENVTPDASTEQAFK